MAFIRDIICINPNAGATSLDRRWDGRRFSRVIDILRAENPTALFCLIGSPDEREYVEGIRSGLRGGVHHSMNLAGLLAFRELIALFSRSKLLITNDSGPMHAAAAVGLPTVALFGPEAPLFYGPIGNMTINLYAGLPCSPCLNIYDAKVFKCPIDRQCMKEISVGQVVAASRSLLRDSIHHADVVEVVH
jgi:heptosyltransferase-2